MESLEGRRQKSNARRSSCSPTDPVPHGKYGKPRIIFCNVIDLASHPFYGNRFFLKRKSYFFVGCRSFKHPVSRLNSPATFRYYDGEGLRQIVADLFKDPVDAVRVGVVQEVGFHFISACAECIRDELRAQGRAADADAQYPGEAVSFFGFDLS